MGEKKTHFEWFRFITPILVTIILFIVNGISSQVKETNDKLFKHLTNDELHVPRSLLVMKAEYDIQCAMSERGRTDILKAIDKLEVKIDKIR